MIYSRMRKMFTAGYSIPLSMEWMFWPIGYRPTIVQGEKGDTVEYRNVEMPQFAPRILMRQVRLTNYDEWMAVLRKLGAVREQR